MKKLAATGLNAGKFSRRFDHTGHYRDFELFTSYSEHRVQPIEDRASGGKLASKVSGYSQNLW